jgi:bacterioferritin (cytochrome b1)
MTKDDLIRGPNAAELASRSVSPWGLALRDMLARERTDEIGHAAFLIDVITHLGGEPTTAPKPFGKPADPKEMLALDLRLEEEAAARYTRRAHEA